MVIAIAAAVYIPMLLEARRAARNERSQIARGGLEPPGDVYTVMRIAYPASFAAMLVEMFIRGNPSAALLSGGATVFAAAKALKWWAIATLGPAWTFRIIAVPASPLVTTGPYRWLRHPNYIGVVGELAGTALMTGASVAGPAAIVAFGVLLLRRIRVEEQLLAATRTS
jgi:methyltransferase